jgi:uncharacterized protein DUF5677
MPAASAAAVAAADELIALVRSLPEHGGGRGDTAARVVHGAYVQGFRRFVSIRDLAARGAGEEAQILLRTLLSLVGRALWVNQPADSVERRERFRRYRRRDLEDGIRMIDDGKAIGLEPDDPGLRASLVAELDELKSDGVGGLPDDRSILTDVQMKPFHARIYASASEHVHFSLSTAVHSLSGVDTIHLEEPRWDIAEEALHLALLVFGFFLEQTDSLIGHGLTESAVRIADGLSGG